MKKYIALLLAIMCLCSCDRISRVKSVAEKGLIELGNGKYAGIYLGSDYININIIGLFKSPYFADYEVENKMAANFIRTSQTIYENDLKESIFETDILFDNIVFVDCKEHLDDIYHTSFISPYSETVIDALGGIETLREDQMYNINLHKDDPDFHKMNYDYCYIQYKDVPFYTLTYKLDNKRLAKVTVAWVKGEKPKITSVFIN